MKPSYLSDFLLSHWVCLWCVDGRFFRLVMLFRELVAEVG